ncbi:hypothetical protein JTE90_000955 [Oedothorax gibbosus]|uniref:Uncharacterized protein n=1 Tax=Oedothorax gibbosus TaxID=931172 RepID=A0AAV6TEV0_9ARAC|nr:hypothetical protein JTE90_000955 [Oedothorax gibbosus]
MSVVGNYVGKTCSFYVDQNKKNVLAVPRLAFRVRPTSLSVVFHRGNQTPALVYFFPMQDVLLITWFFWACQKTPFDVEKKEPGGEGFSFGPPCGGTWKKTRYIPAKEIFHTKYFGNNVQDIWEKGGIVWGAGDICPRYKLTFCFPLLPNWGTCSSNSGKKNPLMLFHPTLEKHKHARPQVLFKTNKLLGKDGIKENKTAGGT